MDATPRAFVKNVQSLVLSKFELCGSWVTVGNDTSSKTPILLQICISNDSCEYTLRRDGAVLPKNLESNFWKNHEITVLFIKDLNFFNEGGHELNAELCKYFQKVASLSMKPINVIFSANRACPPAVLSILKAIPRFGRLDLIRVGPDLQDILFNAISTMKVDTVQISTLCLTQAVFSKIRDFIYNCNFQGLWLDISKDSDISYAVVYKLLHKRLGELRSLGREWILSQKRRLNSEISESDKVLGVLYSRRFLKNQMCLRRAVEWNK
ncbi:hypothetical protein L596_023099 [Steinernema carpocapsae]|uniref:Uncharacterized protein n=1 Tax=Steinernema carpocapsae TaxID=34508 RepID=A0A4U5MCL7_STECR|nr:hypothetical protein L596_023099 [Steinernema carpocapsae]